MPLKDQLKAILSRHEGRLQAITSRELSGVTGQPDRTIRLAIGELLDEGVPICASTQPPAGYFLVSNLQEKADYEKTMKSRIIGDAHRLKMFKHSAALYLKPAEQVRLI